MTEDDVLILGRLEEAYENDVTAIANLLSLALQTELKYIRALREGLAQHDLAGVARSAHSIKGSASNIGAQHVSAIAARIEDRTRASSWDGVSELADTLDRAYEQLCVRVTAYAQESAIRGS